MKQGLTSASYYTKAVSKKMTKVFGYASVFNVADFDNDIIIKGAFKNVDVNKIKFLWQHDSTKPIGKIISLKEDHYGLQMEAQINNDVEYGKAASSLIRQAAIDGLSIGFKSNNHQYDDQGRRILNDIDLLEVSIVTFPANKDAQIRAYKSRELNNIDISNNKISANLESMAYDDEFISDSALNNKLIVNLGRLSKALTKF